MTTTTPAPAPTETPMQILIKSIFHEAGITAADVENIPLETRATAAGLVWELGKPKPNDADMNVLFIFAGPAGDSLDDHLPGDVRVYAAPSKEGLPFVRYTVNRSTSTGYRFASMNAGVFVRRVAYELEQLAVSEGILMECPECEEVIRSDSDECPECGSDFSDDGSSNDEEPEEEAPTTPATPTALKAVT